jgi:hypothetical protein
MTNPKPFGRRSSPQPQQPLRARRQGDAPADGTRPAFAAAAADQSSLLHGNTTLKYIESQSPEEQAAVQVRFKMPWRQLALMASLCFGIASFVLPDATNDALQWVLYGLMAMSLFAGLSRRLQS